MRLFTKLSALLATLLLAALVLAAPASAHFVWIELVQEKDGKPTAHVYFSEGATPGEGHLVERIGHTSVKFHPVGGEPIAVEVKPAVTGEVGELLGEVDSTSTGRLEAVCKYGVFTRGEKSSLLHYYAKFLDGASLGAAAADLPLDVIPNVEGGDLVLSVLWNGKPAAKCQLVVADPAGATHELTTDDKGQAKVGKLQADGVYEARARWVVDTPGEHEGQAYQQELHYGTLVFDTSAPNAASTKDASPAKVREDGSAGRYPELPKGITSFGAAVAGDALYVYGGHFGRAHEYARDSQSHELLRLNLKSPTKWEVVASGPPLQGLAMVEHGGQLYRVGGFSAHNAEGEEHDLRSVADFVRFDPATNEWQELSPLPEPRSSHDAVVVGDKLYVVGGWRLGTEGTKWHETALVADLSKDKPTWEALPQPPFQRRALSLGHLHGKLYAIGGMQEEGGPTTRVDAFDPASGEWSEVKPMQGEGMEGFGSSAFTVGDRLFVSTYGGNLQCLSQDGGEWNIAKKLEEDRFFHRMLPFGDRLILVGGASMAAGKRLQLEEVELAELPKSP